MSLPLPGGASAAPLLQAGGREWSLPDPRARVEATGAAQVDAHWPDGVHLQLRATGGRDQRRLQLTAWAGGDALEVEALGVRLHWAAASRLLVDGFHSWDWAGLRDTADAGSGWWGGIWGIPGAARLHVGLAAPPRLGALRLHWRRGRLDAVTVGEPAQGDERTAEASSLGVALPGGRPIGSDALQVATSGAGVLPRTEAAVDPGPRRTGWMSWNCLGGHITAGEVLAAADRYLQPGDVALVDDGWMRRWGDWVEDPAFGSSLRSLAGTLGQRGVDLGAWVAPFLVDPGSDTARRHPDLLLPDREGRPVVDRRPHRPQLVLDASRREVREHLGRLGAQLAEAGVRVLKPDFLYAGALPGNRVAGSSGVLALRLGLEALLSGFRSAAGSGTAVWACGAPAACVVGLVDACRSGGDAVQGVPGRADPVGADSFLHGPALVEAQARNHAARRVLWGAALPADVDAVTLGRAGPAAPPSQDDLETWLAVAAAADGPFLLSDLAGLPDDRHRRALAALAAAREWTGAGADEIGDPLDGTPVPANHDHFMGG